MNASPASIRTRLRANERHALRIDGRDDAAQLLREPARELERAVHLFLQASYVGVHFHRPLDALRLGVDRGAHGKARAVHDVRAHSRFRFPR